VPIRDALIGAVLEFLAGQDLLTLAEIRAALEDAIDASGPDELSALKERLTTDRGWDYYPPDPLSRRIHYLLADRFLAPDSSVTGAGHLEAIANAPVALFANHLSYSDANVVQVLLHRAGADGLANRLTAAAGPKVFSSRVRRFSSLCFGTVKVPQSAEVSSEEAVLSAREVARAARRAIEVSHERLAEGDAQLLFGERTRSRDGGMLPMLPGVARYLDAPGLWIVPAGLTGSEALFPVGDTTIRSARVTLIIGRPIPAAALIQRANGDKRLIMDCIGLAVAELVPPAYRGVYGDGAALPAASGILCEIR
jgi:1-acyl-sn-glycerol-3-phosphate acyltransferase